MTHTTATLQAACAEIARDLGDNGRVVISVGYSIGRPWLYVSVDSRSGHAMPDAIDFDDALAKARAIADKWTAHATAADREYASWSMPMAAE